MRRPTPNNSKAMKEREALFRRALESAARSFLAAPGTLETPEQLEVRQLAQRIWDRGGLRWRRLDLPLARAAGMLLGCTNHLREEHDRLVQFGWNDNIRRNRLHDRLSLAVLGHLEAIPLDMEPPGGWRHSAADAGVVAADYFFGEWRGGYRSFADDPPLTRESARRELPWMDPYREALLLTLLIDDDRGIERVTSWPGDDLRHDEGTLDLPAMFTTYHIHLARLLRNAPAAELAASSAKLRDQPGNRIAALLAAVEAAFTGDAAAFAKALKQHLTSYRKHTFRVGRMDAAISIEGSILWHVARRRGLALPELPEKLSDIVLR